ncbi:MAG: hypothetical protein Hyperionvirus4_116 [Hyperionvirus sp.]|uniref:Uncharacterized protein n=1 Tax=Hyperionvirus sp. TaxID=2487770 RepID=A0A3G5AAA0_9VIRU|nr:MAG: hypothetical protein Hyperionvirus4_116 [Hyperionvirus sp.]
MGNCWVCNLKDVVIYRRGNPRNDYFFNYESKYDIKCIYRVYRNIKFNKNLKFDSWRIPSDVTYFLLVFNTITEDFIILNDDYEVIFLVRRVWEKNYGDEYFNTIISASMDGVRMRSKELKEFSCVLNEFHYRPDGKGALKAKKHFYGATGELGNSLETVV